MIELAVPGLCEEEKPTPRFLMEYEHLSAVQRGGGAECLIQHSAVRVMGFPVSRVEEIAPVTVYYIHELIAYTCRGGVAPLPDGQMWPGTI